MKFNLVQVLCCFAMSIAPAWASAGDVIDNFSEAEFSGRSAERGEWQFQESQASCVADPELYKQFKNHGPIIKWPHDFKEGTVEFEMKPSDCQRVVFTLNGDGHVFRVTLADETATAAAGPSKVPTRIIAWKTKSSKQNKGDSIKPEGMPDLSAVNDQWVKVRLKIDGSKATLGLNDFTTEIDHPALEREKTMVMLTFAFGKLTVRDFQLRTP
ncbi:MAG: hypothetical protein ACR2NZ_18415 [Rubripirellula sp.]